MIDSCGIVHCGSVGPSQKPKVGYNFAISQYFFTKLSNYICQILHYHFHNASLQSWALSGNEHREKLASCCYCTTLGMRRYGDILIQYRYGGSRYVSWPSAIYRDTSLTFIKSGSHYVVSTFSYSFKKYNLCRRCGLFFINSGERLSTVTVWKNVF